MAKYKLLSKEELVEFEQEFIQYLIVNGIDADSWNNIKKNDRKKADQILELFSDVVFEKVMRKTQYLVNIINNTLFTFKYGESEAELILAKLNNNEEIDWNDQDLVLKLVQENSSLFIFNQQVKAYQTERELEVFQMIESGCYIDEGKLFEKLKFYLSTRTN